MTLTLTLTLFVRELENRVLSIHAVSIQSLQPQVAHVHTKTHVNAFVFTVFSKNFALAGSQRHNLLLADIQNLLKGKRNLRNQNEKTVLQILLDYEQGLRFKGNIYHALREMKPFKSMLLKQKLALPPGFMNCCACSSLIEPNGRHMPPK